MTDIDNLPIYIISQKTIKVNFLSIGSSIQLGASKKLVGTIICQAGEKTKSIVLLLVMAPLATLFRFRPF